MKQHNLLEIPSPVQHFDAGDRLIPFVDRKSDDRQAPAKAVDIDLIGIPDDPKVRASIAADIRGGMGILEFGEPTGPMDERAVLQGDRSIGVIRKRGPKDYQIIVGDVKRDAGSIKSAKEMARGLT